MGSTGWVGRSREPRAASWATILWSCRDDPVRLCMRRDARMLAALLGRSMGLGEAWEVSGTWSGEVEGGSRRAPRRGGQEARPRDPLPGVRRPPWRARRPRAHLAPPRRLAVRDPRPLRRAEDGLPRARRGDRARALGGAAELAPRGPPRGPGARGPRAGPGRRGGGRDARRGRPQAQGHARARGRAGQGGLPTTRAPGAWGTGETSRSRGHTYIPAMPGPGGRRCARRGGRRRQGTAPRTCGRT